MVISSDKDMLQLVGENVKVIALKKGLTDVHIYDAVSVFEKLNVKPEEIKDYLALTGDSSDNIPGVPGIGPKTASQLIKEFKSIDNIYRNIDKIKSKKLAELILVNKERAEFSKKLTELVTDINIDMDAILTKKIKDANISDIQQSFSTLEFRTLSERIKKMDIFKQDYSDEKKFFSNSIQKGLENEKSICNINGDKSKIKCSISSKGIYIKEFASLVKGKVSFNIYDSRNEKNFEDGEDNKKILILFNEKNELLILPFQGQCNDGCFENLKEIFENNDIAKTGFDIKNDYKWLKSIGINTNGSFNDLKILFLLLNPNKTDVSLEEIFKKYFNGNLNEISNFIEKLEIKNHDEETIQAIKTSQQKQDKNMQMSFGQPQLSGIGEDDNIEVRGEITGYGKNEYTYLKNLINNDSFKKHLGFIMFFHQLRDELLKELEKQEMMELYRNIEGPLIKVLAEMEYIGVTIDTAYLLVLIKEYEEEINKITKEIYTISGEEFNINSPQQLSKILYQKLNLKPKRKTKTGLSTNAETLLSLLDANPIIEKILDYREKVKLKNTYIDVLPNIVSKKDGRIHTTYNQLGTTTGRLSSSEPNLQNIPIRTEVGKQIRKAFIPGKGYDMLLSADYSQIELRVLAHLSADEKLIDVFARDEDIHSYTASEIFNVPIENVTEEMRRKAKAINFGIIYGMTEYGLKSRLSISEEEAKNYIELYFARYPEIKGYIDGLIKEAYEKGYAKTLFGRRRPIPELFNVNPRIRSLGERLAVNTPIQGTAADIMKLATVNLFYNLQNFKIDANILMQVHDELVIEFKEKDLDILKQKVKASMEKCTDLKVPLKVDIKYAKNWYI